MNPMSSGRSDGPVAGRSKRFYGLLDREFQKAEAQLGETCSRYFQLATRTVRFRFAGTDLAHDVCRAFAHLETVPTEEADLEVRLWHSHDGALMLPPPPWGDDDYGRRWSIEGFNGRDYRTVYDPILTSLSMIGFRERAAFFWLKNARRYLSYNRASPLMPLLHQWFQPTELSMMHAAAVGIDGSGVLLVGPGGSGKSGTALACLTNGLQYVTDDICLVEAGPEPKAYSLYSSGKAGADTLRRIPALRGREDEVLEDGEDKFVFFLNEIYPENMCARLNIQAIIHPVVANTGKCEWQELAPSKMVRLLAPNTLFMLPDAEDSTLRVAADLCRRLPCYVLRLGTDPAEIGKSVAQLHNRLSDA